MCNDWSSLIFTKLLKTIFTAKKKKNKKIKSFLFHLKRGIEIFVLLFITQNPEEMQWISFV